MSTSFCPECGHQFTAGAKFCSSCGAAATSTTSQTTTQPTRRIVRPRHPRMLAGVCSGIAIYFGWDVALVRILYAVFVCLTLATGIIVYLAAWLLLPDAQYALPPTPTQSAGSQSTTV